LVCAASRQSLNLKRALVSVGIQAASSLLLQYSARLFQATVARSRGPFQVLSVSASNRVRELRDAKSFNVTLLSFEIFTSFVRDPEMATR